MLHIVTLVYRDDSSVYEMLVQDSAEKVLADLNSWISLRNSAMDEEEQPPPVASLGELFDWFDNNMEAFAVDYRVK